LAGVVTAGAYQYLRTAELTVFDKTGFGRKYDGLRVQFHIEKTSESTANKAEIKVFNLSDSSRFRIEEDEMSVELKAGYPGALEIVASGDVSKGVSAKKAPDWLTTMEIQDGGKALQEKHVDFSFTSGTPYQAIIEAALNGLGVAQGPRSFAVSETAVQGFSFSGTAKELLDKLGRRFGLAWSIQNGAVQMGIDGATLPAIAPLIDVYSGLIGNVLKREKGIEFTSLLNGEIIPGHPVVVESRDINGTFLVKKTILDGDTHDGPWQTKVEAEPIG